MQITPLISFFIRFLVSFDAATPFSPHDNTPAMADNTLKVIANIWNFVFSLVRTFLYHIWDSSYSFSFLQSSKDWFPFSLELLDSLLLFSAFPHPCFLFSSPLSFFWPTIQIAISPNYAICTWGNATKFSRIEACYILGFFCEEFMPRASVIF